MRRGIHTGEMSMKKLNKSRDQVLTELRSAYEGGASIRSLVATTGRSYGSIHSMLRESGTTMRSRGGPNHRSRAR
jgi:Helix-turn-helix domain